MSMYVQGSLALKEQPQQKQTRTIRKVKQQMPQRKTKPSIPLGEKMIYLIAILVCVGVAGLILWQYAQIYEVNTRIQKVEYEISLLEKDNNVLQLEGQRLQEPKRLLDLGKALGFVPTSEEAVIPVAPNKTTISSSAER